MLPRINNTHLRIVSAMENNYPSQLLGKAVEEMSRLPGVGKKSAMRLVLHLLKQEPQVTLSLSEALKNLRENVCYCTECHNISDSELCEICSNPKRDKSIVCVVEQVQDVMAIESTHMYKGVYHVLGGSISPMDGIGPRDLSIESLIDRTATGEIEELIFALSPTMEGDTTGYYILRQLRNRGVDITVTTLARGIAQNDELQYTDEVTLGRALTGRVPMKG